MKITHNKIGQNLNIVDGNKAERSSKSNSKNSVSKIAGEVSSDPKANSSEKVALNDSARVDVSPKALEAKKIKELALAAPDVDTEKVARYQKLIDEGQYKVNAKEVADRMVDEYLETV